ncbi:MAG TPA: flagellar M-ring protein FliF [Clostridiales bacterium UBA8153]|nr:flagellar M-ring protein FliF [Clostridiales bacterium UBA8153]
MGSFDSIKKVWGSLARPRQVLIAGVAMALVVGVVLWSHQYARGPAYATLFAGLDARDAGEIVAELERQGIPYRLEQGGSRVLVPEPAVHRTRLTLAAGGLPRGGVVGFEIMDQARLGATDFDRRVNYIRALQGELSRTIMGLQGVEAARVHLALPEPSLFIQQTRPATAAVMLKLHPGSSLDPAQVRGIAHLVSRGVEGLTPENVTIVDYGGRILSLEAGLGAAGRASSAQLDVQGSFQRNLENQLQRLLETVLGYGNVACRVTAELNFDETTVSRRTFQPADGGSGLARRVEELEELFQGQGGAGTPAGITTNVPTYPVAGQPGGQTTYERRDVARDYALNEILEQTVVAPGTIRRLSVAVVVNRELTPAQEAALTNTVAAAIGFDPARNDRITVSGIMFDTTLADQLRRDMERQQEAEARAQRQSRIMMMATAGAAGLLLLVLTVVVLLKGGKRKRLPQPAPVVAAPAVAAELTGASVRGPQDRVARLARQDPAAVAQVLKTWLAEEAKP